MKSTRIHQFAATFPANEHNIEFVTGMCEEASASERVELEHVKGFGYNTGRRLGEAGYLKWAQFDNGFGRITYPDSPPALLELHGSELDRWGFGPLACVWNGLREIGAYCTRIHTALDDGDKTFDFEQLRKLGPVHPFRKKPLTQEQYNISVTWGEAGKMGGGTQVQFYDKSTHPTAPLEVHRVEARFWKVSDKAQQVWEYIFPADPETGYCAWDETLVAAACCAVVKGSISLPESCGWWSKLFEEDMIPFAQPPRDRA